MPLVIPIVATDGLLLVHVPPGVAFTNVEDAYRQILVLPVIIEGTGLSVTDFVVVQVPTVYVIVAVPAATPVSKPVVGFMVMLEGLLLVHTPPATELASVIVLPVHTFELPEIAEGDGFTVTVVVTVQPVPNE